MTIRLMFMLAGGCLLLAWLSGCDIGLGAGIHGTDVDEAEPTTVAYRIETELVPNARVLRQDTTPHWELGRSGYATGNSHLLVVSRITSWIPEKGGERVDRVVERAWLTIPSGTLPGDIVRVQDLPDEDVAYDVSEAGQGFFNMPNRIIGTIELVKEADEALRVAVDINVQPKRRSEWNYEEELVLPKQQKLVYATPVDMKRVLRPENQSFESIFGPVEDDSGEGDVGEGTGESTSEMTDEENIKRLTGKWLADTHRYELRFQFEEPKEQDGEWRGEYLYASTRGGGNYAPGVKTGTYTVKDNHVIMRVATFDFGGADHLHFMKTRVIDLVLRWEGEDKVRLFGNYRDREGHMNVVFTRTEFPDMREERPPVGRGWGNNGR